MMLTMQPRYLTAAPLEHFNEEGYLILEDVLPTQDLEPLKREMEEQIDRCLRRLVEEGKLPNAHGHESIATRLPRARGDCERNGVAVIKDLEGVAGGGFTGREMFNLIRHPNLLAIIESLVGPEIVASSVYRAQIGRASCRGRV